MPERKVEHDTDVWQLVSGYWVGSCRTCLAKDVRMTEGEARAWRTAHEAKAVTWWAVQMANRTPGGSGV